MVSVAPTTRERARDISHSSYRCVRAREREISREILFHSLNTTHHRFAFNAAVVLGNKAVFAKSFGFVYPLSLTCVHMLVSSIGGFVCVHFFRIGTYKPLLANPTKFVILAYVNDVTGSRAISCDASRGELC